MTAVMSAVFEQIDRGPFVARHNIDAQQYQAVFDELVPQGFRPTVLRGYAAGDDARFAAVFEQVDRGAFVARHNIDAQQYQAAFDELVPQGFRPTVLSGYTVGGQHRFAAVFEQIDRGPFVARHNIDAQQYQAVFDELVPQGFRPTVLSGYTAGDDARFAAVFEQVDRGAFVARHNIDAQQLQAVFDELVPQGFRPTVLSGYTVGGQHRFAAVFEQVNRGAFVARHGITSWQYQNDFDEFVPLGFRPSVVDAFDGTGPFDHFTFADDISADQRGRLIDRHIVAFASMGNGGNLTTSEQDALRTAYGKAIHHTVNTDPTANASAAINGSSIAVNFSVLFPKGDNEIAQTLIHEMMHNAGFTHPVRRDAPAGSSCAAPNSALFDCPNDNGQYYGTPPLRSEFCIAGVQSDAAIGVRRAAVASSMSESNCVVGEDGVATIRSG